MIGDGGCGCGGCGGLGRRGGKWGSMLRTECPKSVDWGGGVDGA
jgi:hypothetical protein